MTTAVETRPKGKSARRANIIQAMDGIFKPWFPGDTWDNWRTVLKAMDGLSMNADEIEFFKSIAGGREPPKGPVSELIAACARRTGKDFVASLISTYGSATFDQQDKLRPGERAQVLCLACSRDQSKIVFGYIKSYFDSIPQLKAMVVRETANTFELNNGVDITVATNSFRSIRGKPVFLAILDEAAYMGSETSANPDVELYAALRPALLTIPGSRIIIISSPYRKAGLLWERYRKFFGVSDDKTLVIQAAVRQLNPTISQEAIDAEVAEDPAKAVSELFGQFRDDVGGWMPSEVIEAAVDVGITVRPPRKDFRYVSFCDPSGGARDSFTAAVAHIEEDVAVLDCLVEIKAPFNPTEATATIAGMLKEYGLRDTIGDRYAAAWVVDGFARQGINYKHSERDRSAIYLDVMAAFNSGRVRLLDNRRMVTQFANLERRTSPIGKDRVDHGPGGHDDLCNSAAGALVQLTFQDWSRPGAAWHEIARREMAEMQASGSPKNDAPKPVEREWAAGSVEWHAQQRGEIGPPPQTVIPAHHIARPNPASAWQSEMDESLRKLGMIS